MVRINISLHLWDLLLLMIRKYWHFVLFMIRRERLSKSATKTC